MRNEENYMNHNKYVIGISLLLSYFMHVTTLSCNPDTTDCISCDCVATSRTFFSVRPPFQIGSPERLAMFRGDRMDRRECGRGGALQVVPFGGHSMNSDRLARYFFPDCKQQLHVKENPNESADILATHLNISTMDKSFDSVFSIEPERTIAGFGISYRQEFWHRCDGRAFWLGISLPIIHIRNKVNLCETTIDGGGGVNQNAEGAVANVTEAFKQSTWKFGRIDDCCTLQKTGIADIEVLLGYEVVDLEHCQLESFVGAIIPTSNTPNAVTLFEPITGHNGHTGIFFGNSFSAVTWESQSTDRSLLFTFDMNGQYFFSRNEVRSFDLKNKPWSRYMGVYVSQAQAQDAADAGSFDNSFAIGSPGINEFTKKIDVTPGLSRVINTTILYNGCGKFEGEIGYNFCARETECVKLQYGLRDGIALQSTQLIGTTNTVQQIGNNFNNENDKDVANYDTNLLTAADIDLESARHPCAIEHTIYGSLGYNWECICYPTFIGIGSSYQFAQDNTTLNRWMAWLKVGASF